MSRLPPEGIISNTGPDGGGRSPAFTGWGRRYRNTSLGCYVKSSGRAAHEKSVHIKNQEIDTIIDLDRQELLSILREVQEHSAAPEYTVEVASDPYTDRRMA